MAAQKDIEFPTLVYKKGGEHKAHGCNYSYLAANDLKEYKELLKNGYFATLDEALK